ncbi:LOW QUALITY PROTEIN: hypothetical protein ACHAWO_005201 [Cyclotella atomus]|uniref:Class II aldolase/adducin N-terminal domain-containing protein n=1 Tax=Cyclotella atomus TaxID=382360 RepID=A0ABD3MV22_9STRA
MPPNSLADKPICVSDSFHFSSFYWRESSASLAGLNNDDGDDDSMAGARIRGRSSTVGSESETDQTVLKPLTVANPDRVKLKFYSNVLGDNSTMIHYGKWDGLDTEQPGAYGRASEAMTDYMFKISMGLLPHRAEANNFTYVDLGSGTAASAIHLTKKHSLQVSEATCVNVCHEQNLNANARISELGLSDKIEVIDASFDDTPCPSNTYDLAFSQDAFIHAISKEKAYAEAYRITKPGGAFVFCDLVRGSGPDLTVLELAQFAEKNRINDWLNPSHIIKTCTAVGWSDVKFIDLSTDLRISFQLMLKKVTFVLEHGDTGNSSSRVLMMNYRDSICRRITQIERGVFRWGVFHARKPVLWTWQPPVPFVKTNHLIVDTNENDSDSDEDRMFETNVVVVDILKKMPKETIDALPKTVELIITMSAGLDHIDLDACEAKGIVVKNSGSDAITSHVVQYCLSFIIIGLRDALNQLSVPFPSKGWDLNWNVEGKPLTSSTIAIIGLGNIAKALIEEIRKIAPEARIIYNTWTLRINTTSYLAAQCDVLVPMCALTKQTEHLINEEVIGKLKPESGLINMIRGKVVDTAALQKALENKAIKYAILDTTFPEPLPQDHPLWTLDNCFIFPHYATNTTAVREALVSEIEPIIADHYGLGDSDERRKAEEKALRYDLAVAHRLTSKYGMDMLVWNHISARYRTGCLITPGHKMWSRITPDDLVYSSTNVTADVIHDAVYSARPDIKAIIHLHTPAATSISCLEEGFQPITQDGAYFYGKVATYDWDGLSDDASEGPAIAAAIKAVEGCNTLLMHNHGFVCFGPSVRHAWVLAYYFEKCCEVQLRVMQSGGKLRRPPKAVMQKAAEDSYQPEFAPGVCEWDALCEEIVFD